MRALFITDFYGSDKGRRCGQSEGLGEEGQHLALNLRDDCDHGEACKDGSFASDELRFLQIPREAYIDRISRHCLEIKC